MTHRFSSVIAGEVDLVDIGQPNHHHHHEKLLAIKAYVHPDGEATSFAVKYSTLAPFRVHVTLDEISHILNAVQSASNLMVNRSRLSLDKGHARLLDLCRTAMRPVSTNVLTDPITGDILVLCQFEHLAPLCLRRSNVEARMFLVDLYDATRRASH